MLFGVYFLLNSLEAFLLVTLFFFVGTSSRQIFLFNLSLSRFLLVLVIFCLGICFLLLAVGSMLGKKRITEVEKKLLLNESRLWFALVISAALAGISLFLLTWNREILGNYKEIIRQFEPVLVWLVVLGVQTAFFIGIWYSIHFVNNNHPESNQDSRKELIPIFGLFAGLVLIKAVFVTARSFGPTGIGDEMTYYTMTETLYKGIFSPRDYNHYQYPPLYPLALVITQVFKGWSFEGIKLLNNIFTSSITFPVYLISRRFLNARKSLLTALLSCLIPLHLVFPMRIVSENLYAPIFFWTMYITFVFPKNGKYRLAWDILNGVMIGFLYLTRYITLAVIPFFLFAWWAKPFNVDDQTNKTDQKRKFLHLCVITALILVTFCPWPLIGIDKGISFKYMLGFGIAANTTEEQLTLDRFLVWVFLYGLYFILVAAPVLNLLVIALFQLDIKDLNQEFNRWIIQVLAVVGGFYAAATRHSWRVLYNADLPSTIMGRYLVMFSTLFIITAVTALFNFKKIDFRSGRVFFLATQVIPFGLVIIAQLAIIGNSIIATDGNLLKPLGSLDAYLTKLLGNYYFLIIILIYGLTSWFLWSGAKKRAIWSMVIGLAVFYLAGIPAYYRILMAYQTYPWLSNQIAEMVAHPTPKTPAPDPISIFLPEFPGENYDSEIYNGLYVRGFKEIRMEISSQNAIDAMTTESGFIIQPLEANSIKYPESQIVSYYGREFAIIAVNK